MMIEMASMSLWIHVLSMDVSKLFSRRNIAIHVNCLVKGCGGGPLVPELDARAIFEHIVVRYSDVAPLFDNHLEKWCEQQIGKKLS